MYNINNMNINVCISIFNIYCMCVYSYIHNKYTQYTRIYYVKKTFILDAVNNDFDFV